jgi:predicted outer membrane protein
MNTYKSSRKTRLLVALFVSTGTLVALSVEPVKNPDPNQDPKAQVRPQPGDLDPKSDVLTAEKFACGAALSGSKELRLSTLAAQRAQDPEVKQLAARLVTDHARINQELKTIARTRGITLPPDDFTGATEAAPSRVDPKSPTARPGDPQAQPPTRPTEDTQPPARRTEESTRPDQRPPSTTETTRDVTNPDPQKQITDPQTGVARTGQKSEADVQRIQQEHKMAVQRLERASGEEFDRIYLQEMLRGHEKSVKKFQTASQSLQDQELKQFASKTLPTLQEHHQLVMDLARKKGISPSQAAIN